MKERADKALVETSMSTFQLPVSKPQALFDSYGALAASRKIMQGSAEMSEPSATELSCIKVTPDQ